MSVSAVSAVSDDSVLFSRLQLAKALKEDPGNVHADPPENSAIFLRQRNRNTNSGVRQHSRDNFLFPRPMNLLVPPVLGKNEEHNEKNDNSPQPNQASQQVRRPSQPQVFTSSPRNSLIIPEERRGSTSKTPTTLLDVRQSMLENRQNLHNSIPFSTSSSHRTSVLLQQHKTLPDANGKPHGSSKLGNTHQSSSRPTSTYTINNNVNSRPTSFYKSNKSSNPQDSDNEEEGEHESLSSINSSKSKSQKSREIKKASSSSSDDSDSPPKLPPIKSVTSQSITLEKVEEEDNSSDESEESEQDDDDDSSEDDTPLALKTTPKIKVAPPPRITTRKNSGGRIEAWLEHVSGSPEGPSSRSSTPSHSPTHIHPPRMRRTSEHSVHHHSSSPLGMSPGHRTSLMVEPIHDARNRRPRSAFVPDDKHVPIPDLYQPRKRSNSEFVPRRRTSSIVHEPPPQVPSIPYGRVSPSPRQDSGYWAKDTLVALSDDFRHVSLMNDINSPPKSKGSNLSSNAPKIPPTNNEVAKLINRHRRGSGSSSHNSRSSTPHNSRPSTPQSPVSPLNGNRNHLHTNNSNIHGRISSEQLVTSNRSSVLYPHQQKHRIRS